MGYVLSTFFLGAIFLLLLVTLSLQLLIYLRLSELFLTREDLRRFRLLYASLAIFSAAMLTELGLRLAAVEGGVFLGLPVALRYFSVLPPFFMLTTSLGSRKVLPEFLAAHTVTGYIPLLLLPLWQALGPRPELFLNLSALFWLASDAGHTFWILNTNRNIKTGSDIIPRIIYALEHGLCIADRHGQVLEANPAFRAFTLRFGFKEFATIMEFESQLEQMGRMKQVSVTNLTEGRLLKLKASSYMLNIKSFAIKGKPYTEIAVTDVTIIADAARTLEQENRLLAEENARLQTAMDSIAAEAATVERDRLSRKAHDTWSQRLTVAGLTLDLLLKDKTTIPSPKENLRNILGLLNVEEISSEEDLADLPTTLSNLTAMYNDLGVRIVIDGPTDFSPLREEVLTSVIKEALANAVRHAYANAVHLSFFDLPTGKGVTIQNECFDRNSVTVEGRGLADIRKRVREAGGTVVITKGDVFSVTVGF